MGKIIMQEMAELFSFVKNEDASIYAVSTSEVFEDLFHLSLSSQAFQQLQNLKDMLQICQRDNDKDKWGKGRVTTTFKIMDGFVVIFIYFFFCSLYFVLSL
uniref:Uncharacterized protein n=1 Tax=Leersia perrieri TaxID=77586 RepID=A0A0D9XY66_9ORYZ